MAKRLVTDKQLAANRANAARSTGPRSPEGKARSSQNARRHGFTASSFAIVRLEDLDGIARLADDLVATYQPANSQERFALERIAIAQQGLLRIARLESGLLTACLDEAVDRTDTPFFQMSPELLDGVDVTRQQNRNYCLALGFHRQAVKAPTWTLFLRYQAQAERLYRRAVEDLERLIRLRDTLLKEPNSGPQPEATEPACTPPEANPIRPEPGPPPLAVGRSTSTVHPRQELPVEDVMGPRDAVQQTREIAVCPDREVARRGVFENPEVAEASQPVAKTAFVAQVAPHLRSPVGRAPSPAAGPNTGVRKPRSRDSE